jgi:hypothetical protein
MMEISPTAIETTDEAFAKIARLAGDRMRLELLQPGTRFEPKKTWFEIFNPFEEDYREVLQEVKRCFEDEVHKQPSSPYIHDRILIISSCSIVVTR